jgi:trigger factor
MAPSEAKLPSFDLDRCRHLVIVRPVVEVREDDVTAAFKALADNTPGLEDKGDFNALARLLGVDDALDLRREVRSQLERQSEDAVAKILRLRVWKGLLAGFDQEPTDEAVHLEVASLVRDAEELGQHLSPHKIDTVVTPLARRRVVGAMLVRSLVEALDVHPSREQVQCAFEHHAELYRDPRAVLELLETSSVAAKPVVDELVENLVVEKVLALARVTDQPVSLQTLAEQLERAALELGDA